MSADGKLNSKQQAQRCPQKGLSTRAACHVQLRNLDNIVGGLILLSPISCPLQEDSLLVACMSLGNCFESIALSPSLCH